MDRGLQMKGAKRVLALCAAAALLSLLPGGALAEENWYLDVGQALVERMQILAADDIYISLYTAEEEIAELSQAIGAQDYSQPIQARYLALPDVDMAGDLVKLLDTFMPEDIPEISDSAMNEISRRLPEMMASVFNSRFGEKWLAVSSVLKLEESFIQPEEFKPGLLWLEYPDGAAWVSFSFTGENIVTAVVSPAPVNLMESLTDSMSELQKVGLNLIFPTIPLP